MNQVSVILPAAGASTRFGQNKLTVLLQDVPVIARSVQAFVHRDDVQEIIIATNDRAGLEPAIREHVPFDKIRFCNGGPSRAHTVLTAAGVARSEWLAVHDAARPLVSQALIDRTFAAAFTHGAAAPARPVTLTIKQATGPLPARVQRTLPRHDLWSMQTPQTLRKKDLLRAAEWCPLPLEQITDDVQLLELAGQPVFLVDGDDANLKLTTPLDLHLADLLARQLHSTPAPAK